MEDIIDYERISYGKTAYRRVQRLRRKGERRGIRVPYLNYYLTKPEKPRMVFWIIAIVSAVLFVGVIVGIGLLYNELIKTFSDLEGVGDLLKSAFNPVAVAMSFGLSLVPALAAVLVYLIIALMFAIPVMAVVYFYRFVRDTFYMAKCSKEEFAKGGIVSSRITGLITVIAVAAVIFVVLLTNVPAESAKLYIGLIFGGIAVALGSLLAVTVFEKIKCGKWFAGLEEDKKQNYLEHERGLRRVKRRLDVQKNF